MKIATYRIAGERRVGVIDEQRQTVSAFSLPIADAEWGVLAVIERFPLPPCLSPTPFSQVEFEFTLDLLLDGLERLIRAGRC